MDAMVPKLRNIPVIIFMAGNLPEIGLKLSLMKPCKALRLIFAIGTAGVLGRCAPAGEPPKHNSSKTPII